jgi:hypothetical protein
MGLLIKMLRSSQMPTQFYARQLHSFGSVGNGREFRGEFAFTNILCRWWQMFMGAIKIY